jgi:hypothetical protein
MDEGADNGTANDVQTQAASPKQRGKKRTREEDQPEEDKVSTWWQE